MQTVFDKPFTQQESIDEDTIARVGEILRSGRLHRYNTIEGEISEAAALEREYANWQEAKYCLACASGGTALQYALKAAGLKQGDLVLANAYTLAPVPGAIHAAGGIPVFVEIDDNWHIDLEDLRQKAESSGAKFLMLSHMRGHIADMDAISELCEKAQITMIEDCAHTMGARWKGVRSGNFGKVAAFSAQTYKHINSGEGGLLTTNDDEIAARSIILSGSYMLYGSHGAAPPAEAFEQVKWVTPNQSGRIDNIRAAILRGQLAGLEQNVQRWNERYQMLEKIIGESEAIDVPERVQHEAFVGSSFQFKPKLDPIQMQQFLEGCANRGIDVKWFGPEEPKAFTSRYDSWRYFDNLPKLEKTLSVLSRTCDIRVPLTFDTGDCKLVAEIIVDEANKLRN